MTTCTSLFVQHTEPDYNIICTLVVDAVELLTRMPVSELHFHDRKKQEHEQKMASMCEGTIINAVLQMCVFRLIHQALLPSPITMMNRSFIHWQMNHILKGYSSREITVACLALTLNMLSSPLNVASALCACSTDS